MATRTIPATTEVVCDVCGRVCAPQGTAPRRQEGTLSLRWHVLDYLNQPAAAGSRDLDMCDDCLSRITKALNAVAEEIRAERAE